MRSPWWIVLLGLLALVGLLYGFDLLGEFRPGSSASNEEGPDARHTRPDGVTLAGGPAREGVANTSPTPDPEVAAFQASRVRGTQPGGARIEGRVVRHEDGVPLRGVSVFLRRPDPISHWLDAPTQGRVDLLTAVSAPDGTFVFTDVVPARGYVVRAAQPPFAPSTSESLDLFAGESRQLADLHVGTGLGLGGRVVDHLLAPVAGAQVLVTWRIRSTLQIVLTDLDSVPETEQRTLTASDGRFRFDGLEAGEKTLLVRSPAGAESGWSYIVLGEEGVTDVGDVQLPGPGVLAGRVVWQGGEPISGARVFAAPRFDPLVRSVRTGPDGAFRFEWLEPGQKQVLGILVPGMPVLLEQEVELGDESILVELPVPGRLKGRVVRAVGGTAVPRFEVDARRTNFDHPMVGFVMGIVYPALGGTSFGSPDGTFALPPVAPGIYTVRASAPGLAAGVATQVVVESGKTTEVRIELGAGSSASGTVVRASGTPLSGARLFLFPAGRLEADADTAALATAASSRMPDGTSDAEGTFLLPMQTPGRYDLVATHEDALPGVLRDLELRGEGLTGLRLRLEAAGRIEVEVRAPSGGPAEKEIVWVLFAAGHRAESVTDAFGRCTFRELPIGPCIVRMPSRAQGPRLPEAFHNNGDEPEALRVAYDQLAQDGGQHHVADGRVLQIRLEAPRRTQVRIQLRRAAREVEDITGGYSRANDNSSWRWAQVRASRITLELEPGLHGLWLWGADDHVTHHTLDVPDAPSHDVEIEVPAPSDR